MPSIYRRVEQPQNTVAQDIRTLSSLRSHRHHVDTQSKRRGYTVFWYSVENLLTRSVGLKYILTTGRHTNSDSYSTWPLSPSQSDGGQLGPAQ